MFSKAAIISLLATGALANVFITSPTESIGMTGGQTATISWIDQNGGPSLADFGDAKVGIFTGNANQQTLLQLVVDNVNVATTASIQFTPDASIGPNGNDYFIRVESINLKDSASPQFPALAFSSRFTMSGMSGTFNATVQAQIDGQSTAPIGGTAAPSTATSASHSASTTGSGSPSGTKANAAASPSSTAKDNNGAMSMATTTASRLVGVLAGVVVVSYIL
ncbi:hypothetical protein D9758_005396 [Tetrapyrgos nigripes]|jgi:hypothetical protein|uniref:Yeast cell wall synthesis Kre9/Knh1-like N-terminal domain-containing protein n=1 Tax=Tetrapyrgos nigripes TaxID=182062 RepID=A0A8H5LQ17_9AGAR|nr:hypothetical protein D9758_005396 [Tetrapyrgos nigripes]